MNSENPRRITRREALGYIAAVAVGVVLAGCTNTSHDTEPKVPHIAAFKDIKDFQNMNSSKEWDQYTLQDHINEAIRKSLDLHKQQDVLLPPGEILVNKPLTAVIPEGARITIRGNEKGSRLSLDSSLSDIPKDWGSFAQRSILYFPDMAGELVIDNIQFFGGSQRAGKYGYRPPASPWDAMVFIDGPGDGARTAPPIAAARQAQGTVRVSNCRFQGSETTGLLVQNLQNATVSNCEGKNLDSIITSPWTDNISVDHLRGMNFTSDGIYISNAVHVVLHDNQIMTSRQGYDLQGVSTATLTKCNAYDCGIAYAVSKSEADNKPSQHITLTESDSKDCAVIYAFGNVETPYVHTAQHIYSNEWFVKSDQNDFLHSWGIANPDQIRNALPITLYDSSATKPSGIFQDVKIYFETHVDSSRLPSEEGIQKTFA